MQSQQFWSLSASKLFHDGGFPLRAHVSDGLFRPRYLSLNALIRRCFDLSGPEHQSAPSSHLSPYTPIFSLQDSVPSFSHGSLVPAHFTESEGLASLSQAELVKETLLPFRGKPCLLSERTL